MPFKSGLQQPGVGEAGTVRPILQKNTQEPGSIASLDPQAPAPPHPVPGDVYG